MDTPPNFSIMENNHSDNPSSIITTIITKKLISDPILVSTQRRMRASYNNY